MGKRLVFLTFGIISEVCAVLDLTDGKRSMFFLNLGLGLYCFCRAFQSCGVFGDKK